MKAMFDADQAARSNPAGIDWDVLAPQDEVRRLRTRALIDAGRLLTADDFYRAAFVFQHGAAPADYLLAHVLATAAVARGHRDAPWIAELLGQLRHQLEQVADQAESATWKIGASSSLLMATMTLESFMPARCWIAPEMPTAM
jgi:hypothetical protein